ncbi:MAG: MepB family protein [Carnobacterium sp.]|nr:MepB family protein [Carnobacterium sp.]
MHDFYKALAHATNLIYQPNGLSVKSVLEETQNAKYGAGTFELSSKTIRFRVANPTPTKTGQFVSFWKKDERNKNQAYSYDKSPDLLVITTFTRENKWGQFIFPKKVLLEEGILSSNSIKGKMGIRVYPSWDKPASKLALQTQRWQLPYFVDMSERDKQSIEKILRLYSF